jgi:uncharacterized protein YdeI (YjbR/CyaY-like superfamily)
MSYQFNVDQYLMDGCMRCKYGATPQCKVRRWQEVLVELRVLALQTGLKETIKWGVPCYTHKEKNIITVNAFKDYACISFFKGALLSDPKKILSKHGEESQAFRTLKFTEVKQISPVSDTVLAYIAEAVALEEAGKKIEYKKEPTPLPEELITAFAEDPGFERAFKALTPGRQRGYILYFAQAKQSATRINRIEKSKDAVLLGKGMNE